MSAESIASATILRQQDDTFWVTVNFNDGQPATTADALPDISAVLEFIVGVSEGPKTDEERAGDPAALESGPISEELRESSQAPVARRPSSRKRQSPARRKR